MSLSSKLSQIATRGKTLIHHSASLCNALVSKQATSTALVKDVLLNEARRENNAVAVNLLHAEKQIGLVQYHGVMDYWKLHVKQDQDQQEQQVGSVNDGGKGDGGYVFDHDSSRVGDHQTKSSSTTTSSTTTTTIKKKARVAFMITTAQRAQLSQRGYESSQIRKLTPTEALLILEHNIAPDNNTDILKQIVAENDEMKRLEAEEEMAAIAMMELEQQQQQQVVEMKTETEITEMTLNQNNDNNGNDDGKQTEILRISETSSIVASTTTTNNNDNVGKDDTPQTIDTEPFFDNDDDDDDDNNDDGNQWYEVIQMTSSTDDPHQVSEEQQQQQKHNVVALYRSKEEAYSFVEIKQGFATKRKHTNTRDHSNDATYRVRRRRVDSDIETK